jgi:hypothetical protein
VTSSDRKREIASLRLIDVHHHVVLPEYEAALKRSGAVDPSRPFRKGDPPAIVCEKMNEIGVAAAVVNPLTVAGVHHGNDADARYLARSARRWRSSRVRGRPNSASSRRCRCPTSMARSSKWPMRSTC